MKETHFISITVAAIIQIICQILPFFNIKALFVSIVLKIVSGYVCNHGSPSGERDTASPRGRYGERPQRDSV